MRAFEEGDALHANRIWSSNCSRISS
jgi:hypothetical protein